MPHEKLVFELFDHRLVRLGPTAPMNVAQWITVSVVAQGDKFLALPDMRCQRDAAFLVFHGARQGNRRQGIALGQDQSTLRQWQAEMRQATP